MENHNQSDQTNKSAQNDYIDARHTRIEHLRKTMVALAIVSVVLFIGFLVFNAISSGRNHAKDVVKGDQLVLDNPRFIGHSQSGGTIIVTAQEATRNIGNIQSAINLIKPKMTTSSGAEISGDNGVWNSSTQELELSNNVIMRHKKGHNASAQKAFWHPTEGKLDFNGGVTINIGEGSAISNQMIYNTNQNVVSGDGGVQITMRFGIANAQSYEYYPDQERIVLRGGAKLIFNGRK